MAKPGDFRGPDTDKTDPNLRVPTAAELAALPSIGTPAPQRARQGAQSQGNPLPFAPASQQRTPTQSAAPNTAQRIAPAQPRPAVRMPDLGPLDSFMRDPAISEIMVNDLRNVMVESGGRMSFSGFAFQTADELTRVVRALLDATGKILTPDSPIVDASLPDGSRINIIGPPLTIGGPSITIRKFPTRRFSIEDLMKAEMLDRRMAYFLNACVIGRVNILVAGGTGSGKTTVLNALGALVPKAERLVTIEDTPELVVDHTNSVRLQTKPQSPTLPAITARDLVANALRMRPDRIIVGECRRAEAFDMLQAMNTGHAGSMTTIHANSARDALARVETLCMLAATELPLTAIRRQISSAIDLVLFVRRFRNGKRRIVQISQLTGMEHETFTMQDLFLWDHDQNAFRCMGMVPTFLPQLREHGIELPKDFFS